MNAPRSVQSLSRFNIVATIVLAIIATTLIGLGAAVAYISVLVIGENRVTQRLQSANVAMRQIDARLQTRELIELNALAKSGHSAFPAFSQTYRPNHPSVLDAGVRSNLDVRLNLPIEHHLTQAVTMWIESLPHEFQRWWIFRDRSGTRFAVKMDYDSPAGRPMMDRRLELLGSLYDMHFAWYPRLESSAGTLTKALNAHGLAGKFSPLTLDGTVRSSDGIGGPIHGHVTVNETKIGGEAIAVAVPLEGKGGLIVAMAKRSELMGVTHYIQAIAGGATAILLIVWGAAIAWIRGTRRQADFAMRQGNFVAAVSHELRTPLTAIRGAAEMLSLDMVPPAKVPSYYQTILAESDRLRRMVEQVLDFDRLQRGQFHVEVAPTDLSGLVHRIADMMQPMATKRDVVLHVEVPMAITVRTDPDTTTQALTNLIDNAIKFSPTGATVTVTLAQHDGRAIVSISDEGPGVPPRERQRIFEPFYRVGDENTRRTKGSGLGLYLVRQYVESVGGSVRVTEAPTGGARFEVEWPSV